MFHKGLLLQLTQKTLSVHGNIWSQICLYSVAEPTVQSKFNYETQIIEDLN